MYPAFCASLSSSELILSYSQFPIQLKLLSQELGHRTPIHCVRVPNDDVAEWLLGVEVAQLGFVGSSMTLADHAYPTAHAILNHEVHSRVADDFYRHARRLAHRIPIPVMCTQVVRGIDRECLCSILTSGHF